MRYISKALILALAAFFAAGNVSFGTDHIDWISEWDPAMFAELLDCEFRNDTLFVAGVSGFSIVDVSNIEEPYLLGRYTPPGHPYERYYHIAVGDDGYAYGFSREDGISVIEFNNLMPPHRIEVYNTGSLSFEDGYIVGNVLYVTAHEDGLFTFVINNNGGLVFVNQDDISPVNATAIAIKDSLAFIADGAGGVLVMDISVLDNPAFVSRIATSSTAQDIGFYGNYAAVAVGGLGVDIIDYSDPYNPVFLSNITGSGSAFNLAVENNLVYAARWDDIEVIDIFDPYNPVLAGWEDTRTRAMGLTVNDSVIYVADWANVETFRFGAGNQRDIDLEFTLIDFGSVETGVTVNTIFEIHNTGGTMLNVTDFTIYNGNFNVTPGFAQILPDSSYEFTLSFTAPDQNYISSFIRILSDDPDEPSIRFNLFANGSPRLSIGDPAPDFTLEDTYGDFYTLSDYYGKVVLLAFFASW